MSSHEELNAFEQENDVSEENASPVNGEHNEKMQEEIDNPSLDPTVPEQMVPLIEECLKSGNSSKQEGIWPIIWDFAGQAVYRAIHPIFMSPDAVYVLVFDLTKKLFETAHCYMKSPGQEEKIIKGPDSRDTNLDHIMRWMDAVHSLKQPESSSSSNTFPPVILVGTHVDKLDGNAQEEVTSMVDQLDSNFTEHFTNHVSGDCYAINNTKAGKEKNQEDSKIAELRKHIIDLANKMPHIRNQIPLQWLCVEKEIEKKFQGKKCVTKQVFKNQIAKQIKREDEVEELLHFLHARGTVVCHDYINNETIISLVVLDPKWLISVLYQIITAKPNEFCLRKHHKKLLKEGILAQELINDACKKLKLENIKEGLISIMEKFNLICEWKRKDEKIRYYVPCMVNNDVNIVNSSRGLVAVYITFSTKYIPSGLFFRLVVLFLKWASSMCSCKQPQLFANAAKFFVGGVNCIRFVCYKRVIMLQIRKLRSTGKQDNSDPLASQPSIYEEVLRFVVGRFINTMIFIHFSSNL